MSSMPQSDRTVEQVYDLVNGLGSERQRAEVARAALIAAQYRVKQLAAPKPQHKEKQSNG